MVNLKELSIRAQTGEGAPPLAGPPRRWMSRYLLPGTIGLGFLMVLGWSLRSTLTPALPVKVMPVLTARHARQAEGTPLFQGAGWIEPRPQPVLVTALTEGVVAKIHVVENSPVKEGDVIAELIAEDAELAAKAAEAEVRLRKADVASAKAQWEAAKTNLGQPVNLRAALAEARAAAAQKEIELDTLPFQQSGLEAKRRKAEVLFRSQVAAHASGALPEAQFQQSKAEFEAAEEALKEVNARTNRLKDEVMALQEKRTALALRLELKVDETRAEAESRALFDAAHARLDLAENALAVVQLRQKRLQVIAPMTGRVLNLIARPGSRLMGQDPRGMVESSSVVSLYDPHSLQVRADVRIEDAWQIQVGQKVRITTAAVPAGPLGGEVLFMTSQADVQKNTIQVKVSIDRAPDVLRPEMLVQVTFLAPPSVGAGKSSSESLRVFVPRSLVREEDGKKMVWVADNAAGVARKRAVQTGMATGETIEVSAGLQVSDRLIITNLDDLREGQRIAIAEETTSLPR